LTISRAHCLDVEIGAAMCPHPIKRATCCHLC
jgi:hypothetical protein